MGKKRHYYSGGNTCLGFYHFYPTMASENVERKIILKGGPGVGKSNFMREIGESFAALGYDLAYHWCSSDPDSLDGLVIGDLFCLLDGTSPHVIDPQYPGAVDEIVNLGCYWNRGKIRENRQAVISLTNTISSYFKLAYLRLQESSIAWQEMQFYTNASMHWPSVNKNILALGQDFLATGKFSDVKPRHLFAAAITPGGIITKHDSLIDADYSIYAVSGRPGCGLQMLFSYLLQQIELNSLEAEILHNPFIPQDIDFILFPQAKSVLIDISANVVDYAALLPGRFKRRLDFDLLLQNSAAHTEDFQRAKERCSAGIEAAIHFLSQAKTLHDELEAFYTPHMDFAAMNAFRNALCEELAGNVTD